MTTELAPLPAPPPEPKAVVSLDVVAPKLRAGILATFDSMRALGLDPIVAESLRTDERQTWLFGFGRDYDDGRGRVTNAPTGQWSWHMYGLAVDVTSRALGDDVGGLFWYHLGKIAKRNGLAWGGDWPRFTDRPHVQWGPPMRQSPSSRAYDLYQTGGFEAVWREVGAA